MQEDKLLHPVAYASRALTPAERNYSITELETLAVVWSLSHFHSYLYRHAVVVYTDHSAVRDVLGKPTLSAKHARWWRKVYASGIRNLKIVYRPGRSNANADALSRCPQAQAPVEGIGEAEFQVATILSQPSSPNETTISNLLHGGSLMTQTEAFSVEQRRDHDLREISRRKNYPQTPREHSRLSCTVQCTHSSMAPCVW